jgi:prevent-host-death family protein
MRKRPGVNEGRAPLAPSETTPWTVANAKARLSEVLDKARDEGPQFISRNGKQAVVVVAVDEWERKTKRKDTLADFLLNSPLHGSDVDLERAPFEPRDIEL